MTLAQTIIYGDESVLARALLAEQDLNQIDEYGYTPLIQAAIVNSVSKTKLILQTGADPNFPDLTGRTALHWAADNNNHELCKLLLQHKADPNAYTYAAQPILTMPILRNNVPIKRLLKQRGAHVNFAADFINTKLLGHRFELEGRVDIVNHNNTFIEAEFEGFYLEFSLELIANSLLDFRKNFGAKYLKHYFNKLNVIIRSLKNAAELLKYQHYLTDRGKFDKRIDKLLNEMPLMLPISYQGHAICFIQLWDFLIRCDRGEFGKKNGTIIFYLMENPHAFNKSLVKELLYKRQHKDFINKALIKLLGLKPIQQIPLLPQKSGNCSWTNVEAAVPAIMFLLLLDENTADDMEKCQQGALDIYQQWVDWDKHRALHFCAESFQQSSPARKASKAALLAAILFQALEYNNPEHQEAANLILDIITLPAYEYILQSYVRAFYFERQHPLLKNLLNYLDVYGYNTTYLLESVLPKEEDG